MQRRELIKALAGIALAPTLTVNGKVLSAAAAIPEGHYMLFVDEASVNIDSLANTSNPPGVSMEIIPLRIPSDKTIQDVVALYKVSESE